MNKIGWSKKELIFDKLPYLCTHMCFLPLLKHIIAVLRTDFFHKDLYQITCKFNIKCITAPKNIMIHVHGYLKCHVKITTRFNVESTGSG